MIIIGLTGSIGMGKSTLAQQFGQCGAAVCNSDAIVHELLATGGAAVSKVTKLFPEARKGGCIDRKRLGKEVFGSKTKLKKLEAILHPLVRKAQDLFIADAKREGKAVAVLDIPLLFETQGEKRCDVTVVATAPAAVQRQRVFKRPGMTEEKFQRILKHQMSDGEKRKRADFVVQTGRGKRASLKRVKQILSQLIAKPAIKKA